MQPLSGGCHSNGCPFLASASLTLSASDDFVVLWLPGGCLYYHAGLRVAMLHMMLEGAGAASLASMPLHGILR